ncbi:glutamate-1-semialdehyde 2,1-aminomutase [soil metagenome]
MALPAQNVENPYGDIRTYERSVEHQQRAHRLIPGGAHTYARGDDQMPAAAPVVVDRGEGCFVWDVDGNRYIEYGMGLRAVTLGHAFKPVNDAVAWQLGRGAGFTRPAALELEAAEAFLDLVPGADMVKFCKDGSNATTAAIKLARAATGRDIVAYCSDHPFFSQDDWFIGTTPMNAGIPQAISDLSIGFPYGDLAALERVLVERDGEIAAVILEPDRGSEDVGSYLAGVRDLCRRNGVVLIFDEMITGFRWHNGGAQALYNVTPDLSAFGKALANGFSVSALCGKREIMELGGLHHARDRVFLLSGTHGAELPALAASIATIETYRSRDVVGHLHGAGARLRRGIAAKTAALGISDYFEVLGRDCNLVYATRDESGNPSQDFRTLFLQETIARGLLAPSLVTALAHDNDIIDETIEIVGEALKVYALALTNGVHTHLRGRPVQPVFRRLNDPVH